MNNICVVGQGWHVKLYNVPVGWKLLNIRFGKALRLDLAESLRQAEEGLIVFCLGHIISRQLWVAAGVREHREDIEEEARAIGGGVTGELGWSCGQLEWRYSHVARGQQTCGGRASPTSVVAEAATPVAVVVGVARPVSVDVGALVSWMMVMVETSAVILTSLHMEVARHGHMMTPSTEARLEMRLEMIRGRRVEEAGAHQHPVIGVSLVVEVDIGHPLRLLVQVSGQRGWYRGPGGSWELDHPRARLAGASVTRGQSSRELSSGLGLDVASVA